MTRTASTCIAEEVKGTHSFKIANYSQRKSFGFRRYISSTFTACGHDWCIRYYPGGASAGTKDYVAVHLDFAHKGVVKVETSLTLLYDFRLLNRATGLSSSVFSAPAPVRFSSAFGQFSWGTNKFMKKSELGEASEYLQDNCLTLECHVTVIKRSLVEEEVLGVQVPPSDLMEDLGKLMEATEEADVTFNVRGEVFHAHKFMIAVRSPVFKAKLYGSMANSITIDDMEPAIFKAFLRFVYTDSLPAMEDLDGNVNCKAIRELLVAADRYAVKRLKLICEDILCKGLDVENIAATLTF